MQDLDRYRAWIHRSWSPLPSHQPPFLRLGTRPCSLCRQSNSIDEILQKKNAFTSLRAFLALPNFASAAARFLPFPVTGFSVEGSGISSSSTDILSFEYLSFASVARMILRSKKTTKKDNSNSEMIALAYDTYMESWSGCMRGVWKKIMIKQFILNGNLLSFKFFFNLNAIF
jgi:hypothetical protein